jgi:UDPglucose 6-dehydrogenase
MHTVVVGTGYVGLVTGTCFADAGNQVTCVDIDEKKIQALQRGEIPIYEPGLSELVRRNSHSGRLHFTTDLATAVKKADVIYLAVGTPQGSDGAADLSAIWAVARQIAPFLLPHAVVVTKSTVPVGTNAKLDAMLRELTGRNVDVASNPEFLKEGAAIEDFTKPDRVVVGVRRKEVADILHKLYKPFLRTDKPYLVMSPESAELTKYVANAMLATKISFINLMANLCEKFTADINDVRRGIGHDSRIGFAFLFPGVGYGGSCFPKDVRAMISTFQQNQIDSRLLDAVDWINEHQKTVMQEKIRDRFGDLRGKKIAIWGVAFKPRTDDIREAPALVLMDYLLQQGAIIRAHDPEALPNTQKIFGKKIGYDEDMMMSLEDADALAILTEWSEYRTPDFDAMRKLMKQPIIFDGRNLYDLETVRDGGFEYYSIGRPAVRRS